MLSSSSVHQSAVIRALLNKVELKLYAIPFLFIFIRMWGTIQFIFSIIVSENGGIDSNGCVMSHKLYIAYFALAVLQVSRNHLSVTVRISTARAYLSNIVTFIIIHLLHI